MTGYPRQETAVCGGCAHFRRHFVRCGRRYAPLSYGHCVFPRRKPRRAEEGCARFQPRRET